jgi:invasion protein IalB
MTQTNTVLIAIGAFVLGVVATFGAEHFLFAKKDLRDDMQTVGVYQGWRLSCPPRTSKAGVCVLQQALGRKGSNAVIAELNVVPKDKADMLSIVAPLGVFILPGLKVSVGSNEQKTLQYKTCLQMGCVATMPMDSGFADAMAKNGAIQVTVVADGKPAALNFSLAGYRDALAARAVDTAARSK